MLTVLYTTTTATIASISIAVFSTATSIVTSIVIGSIPGVIISSLFIVWPFLSTIFAADATADATATTTAIDVVIVPLGVVLTGNVTVTDLRDVYRRRTYTGRMGIYHGIGGQGTGRFQAWLDRLTRGKLHRAECHHHSDHVLA